MDLSPEADEWEAGYGRGDDPVEVALARDAIEAEMIQGLLENAGLHSLLLPARNPGVLGALRWLDPIGTPQRVMVRADQARRARRLLEETLVVEDGEVAEGPE